MSFSQIPFHKLSFLMLCLLWVALTFSTALVEISFVAALVFWLGWKIQKRTLMPSFNISRRIWVPLAGFVLVSVFSYFWSEYPQNSFRGVFKVLQQVFTFWLVFDVFHKKEDFNFFHKVFMGTLLIVILNSFHQYFRGEDLIRGYEGLPSRAGTRVTGSFHSYGLLGSYLILVLPYVGAMLFYHVRFSRSLKKTLAYLLVFVSGLTVLYWTRSRGCFLAFLAGVFMLIIWARNLRLFVYGFLAVLTGLMMMPWSMIIHFDLELKEQSVIERIDLWNRALDVIKAKPLTGTGINTYADAHQKYDTVKSWRVKDYYAHNGYLQLAAEVGLPALFLFITFLCVFFVTGYRRVFVFSNKMASFQLSGVLLGLFNFLVLVFVDTVFHNLQAVIAFWYYLGFQQTFQKRMDA